MAFKKGENTNRKDIPNKITQDAREVFKLTLEGQVPHLTEAFEQVRETDPAKYLELIAKYAQYFVPKMVDVNLGGKVINVITED